MYLPTDDPRDAPNVAAMWKGTSDQYILITAHYDHLRPRTRGIDRIYNGADDNASGTAALLAIADALNAIRPTVERSIVLVAFTGEEAGFVGSEHFVSSEPIPIDNIMGLINLDMISRGIPNTIFLEGSSMAPNISKIIDEKNTQIGLTIIRDQYPDWLDRSDQAPFMYVGVPCVFFSVEDHEDYHRVSDHADKIMPDLAAKTANLTLQTAIGLARPTVP